MMTTFTQPTPTMVSREPASGDRCQRTRELFSLALSSDSEDERRHLIDTVIEMHLGLAYREAARYQSRGIALDDLKQVAALALTKAAHRYEVTSGHDFISYAVPTIRGELRKHFRDRGWMVRPPRRIQELQARVNAAEAELSSRLGRSPKPSEVAEHLEEPLEAVIEALANEGCFVPTSLDFPSGQDGTFTLGDLLRSDGDEHERADARLMLESKMERLKERDRLIVGLRFWDGLTQREIADRIGVSQMQVSRLLTRILSQLRQGIGELDAAQTDRRAR